MLKANSMTCAARAGWDTQLSHRYPVLTIPIPTDWQRQVHPFSCSTKTWNMLILLNFCYLTLCKLIILNCVICINTLKLQLPLQILFFHDIYNLNNTNPWNQVPCNPPDKPNLGQWRAECWNGDMKPLGSRRTFAARGNCSVYWSHPAAGVDGSGQLPGTCN